MKINELRAQLQKLGKTRIKLRKAKKKLPTLRTEINELKTVELVNKCKD